MPSNEALAGRGSAMIPPTPRSPGRPRKLDRQQEAELIKAYRAGDRWDALTERFGVSVETLRRLLWENEVIGERDTSARRYITWSMEKQRKERTEKAEKENAVLRKAVKRYDARIAALRDQVVQMGGVPCE